MKITTAKEMRKLAKERRKQAKLEEKRCKANESISPAMMTLEQVCELLGKEIKIIP